MVTVGLVLSLVAAAEAETPAVETPAVETPAVEAPAEEAPAEEAPTEEAPAEESAASDKSATSAEVTGDGAESGVDLPLGAPVARPPDSALERRIKKSRRTRAEDAILTKSDGADYGDPGVATGEETFVGEERPAFLRHRWPGGALALGAFVGFGAGYYYAGVPRWGLVFSLVDAVLVSGFVASTVALNNLVIEHDFNQGRSLARDERDFTKREQRWYTASIVFALASVGSRAFQAFGGLRAARRTNTTIDSFSFVPLGDGAALEIGWSW